MKPVSAAAVEAPVREVAAEEYALRECGYGKTGVRLLHVRRDGHVHSVRELEVQTHLRLDSHQDYLRGDNSHIVATDTQKNTVYVLAKKFGVESPEEFALLACSHFLYTYRQVEEARVRVEEMPWERLQCGADAHRHAFIMAPAAARHAVVTLRRNEKPTIEGGITGLRVLKTTQSAFTDFVQDEFCTLPEAHDRLFSTVITASWKYSVANGVDFDNVWDAVKDCILENFAGPPDTGVFSPSVQNTLYLTEKTILDKIPQILEVEMWMPNKHYFSIDMSRLPVKGENKEVYQPVDHPSGLIHGKLKRKQALVSKL